MLDSKESPAGEVQMPLITSHLSTLQFLQRLAIAGHNFLEICLPSDGNGRTENYANIINLTPRLKTKRQKSKFCIEMDQRSKC